MARVRYSPIFLLLLWCGNLPAQTSAGTETEPAAVLEVGGAASRSLTEHHSSYGGGVAVEVTPIEKWLELELGTTALFARHSTEWGTDLLFKKPWTFSPKAEFMIGVGPEWVRAKNSGISSNSVGFEAVLDFMFWPSAKHRFGWYLEPACDYGFARGHEKSIGITAGLLIAIPKKGR